MTVAPLQQFLVTPNPTHRVRQFWFALSLVYAAIYGAIALHEAFSHPYIVSDDARQHIFWMRRFNDPELFPNDLIADYFQSVAPEGYATVYRLGAMLGLDPFLLGKLLPFALGLVVTGYGFHLCLQLLPVPMAGFLATALFNQNLWMRDDLASGTARAFLNPIFLAFLYYLLRRSLFPALAAIALTGLFYPQYVLVSAGLLVLQSLRWEKGRLGLTCNRRDLTMSLAGLALAFCVLLPYALQVSEFDPVISASEAKTLPEFLPGGRVRFFYDDFGRFWLSGGRSGIQPALDPPLLCAGLLLPLLWRFPSRFPLLARVGDDIRVLPRLIVVSLGLFFAAHALLFQLHLPSRYTQHSLRVVMALAASVVLTVGLDAILKWAKGRSRQFVAGATTIALFAYLLGYPTTLHDFPKTNYIVGESPALYRYFAQQPKDSLIASISPEADNLPTFARRSILVGREYAIPYHLGYYRRFRQRLSDLIRAQYTSESGDLRRFLQEYNIDFWLLDRAAFDSEYVRHHPWLDQYPQARDKVLEQLQYGNSPALARVLEPCAAFRSDRSIVLPTTCILNTLP